MCDKVLCKHWKAFPAVLDLTCMSLHVQYLCQRSFRWNFAQYLWLNKRCGYFIYKLSSRHPNCPSLQWRIVVFLQYSEGGIENALMLVKGSIWLHRTVIVFSTFDTNHLSGINNTSLMRPSGLWCVEQFWNEEANSSVWPLGRHCLTWL